MVFNQMMKTFPTSGSNAGGQDADLVALQEAKDADLEETLARLKAFEVGDD